MDAASTIPRTTTDLPSPWALLVIASAFAPLLLTAVDVGYAVLAHVAWINIAALALLVLQRPRPAHSDQLHVIALGSFSITIVTLALPFLVGAPQWIRGLMALPAFLAPLVATVKLFGDLRKRSHPDTLISHRLVAACGLASAVLWISLQIFVDTWRGDFSGPSPDYANWLARYGANTVDYATTVVAGFPIQGVQGQQSAYASGYLTPDKGLFVLVANFAILLGVAVAAMTRVRHARTVFITAIASGFVAALAGVAGLARLGIWLD